MQNSKIAAQGDILVVDDDPDISQALMDFLEYNGYHVDLAGTGLEALANRDSRPIPQSFWISDCRISTASSS